VSVSFHLPEPPNVSRQLRIEACGETHVGQIRAKNEDNFAVLEPLGLFMVADGMGGRAGGEVASTLAIASGREAFADPDTTTWPTAGVQPCQGPSPRLLLAGIHRANDRIFHAGSADPAKKGMGTTFAGVLVAGEQVTIAHVGDSRVYRLRDRKLDLMTEDHSLLNSYLQTGQLDPAHAQSFPYPHILTRALGTDETVEVDTCVGMAMPGDVMLLCSDGLWGVLKPREIASILLKHRALRQAARRLIDRANEQGGPDNITCVLVRWG
jgi:serine/threonine protein phosphatase PrpC